MECPPMAKKPGEPLKLKIKEQYALQPMMVIPVPSPDCKLDFNYKFNGADWICNCNEGHQQSPIQLPSHESAWQIEEGFKF